MIINERLAFRFVVSSGNTVLSTGYEIILAQNTKLRDSRAPLRDLGFWHGHR